MKSNDEVRVLVGEPWDFSSPEGDNLFSGRIINVMSTRFGEALIIKVRRPFTIDGSEVSYLLAMHRHVNEVTWRHITALEVPIDQLDSVLQNDDVTAALKIVVVGTIALAD